MAKRENAIIRRGGFRDFAMQPGGMHRRIKFEVIFECALSQIVLKRGCHEIKTGDFLHGRSCYFNTLYGLELYG